jgi:hypothetical protein
MVAGKVQRGPPPLQMSGSDVNGPAYPPFRDRPQVHTRTPPAGGGGRLTPQHTSLYSDLDCIVATACFRLGVLRLNVRFSRLNVRNRLKITKSTNFKAYFRCRLPLNQGEEDTASDRPRDTFAHIGLAG